MRTLMFCLGVVPWVALSPAWPASFTGIVSLPNQPIVRAMEQDPAGNLYIAGWAPAASSQSQTNADAFVARLSSDGLAVQFWTVLSGSGFETVTGLTLAVDGSVLVVGSTSSADFPVTSDAAQPKNTAGAGNFTGFFSRLDANGKVLYASYLNGSSQALPQFSLSPLAIATDVSGAAYITGQGVLTSTAGALPALSYFGDGFFVLKLDGKGKTVFATGATGGTSIAIDHQGFIYISGSARSGYPVPITADAFQSTTVDSICGGTGGGPSLRISFNCYHQYVVKLDPIASTVVYGTWLSGTYGASPAGMQVDSQDNVILAGSTQSSDFPVTAEAFQKASFAATPPVANLERLIPIARAIPGPPTTSYVAKLNTTGTGLVFATFLGGSGQDFITSMAEDSEGNILLAGSAQSPDFPGLTPVPDACRPSYLHGAPFVTRLSADGSALTESLLPHGLEAPPSGQPLLAAFGEQGRAFVVAGASVASLNLFATPSPLTCVVDSADLAPLEQIAPGQLLSLFGAHIGAATNVTTQPKDGFLPTAAGTVMVSFDGVPAPVLYSSSSQINVQVPYEIASHPTVTMQISGGASPLSRNFSVVALEPSAFVLPGYAVCQGTVTNSQLPLALNEDGSQNGCDNPAAAGSTVTLFVNGLGLAGGEPSTGAITSTGTAPKIAVLVSGDAALVSAESDAGSVNGVWKVQVKVTQAEPQTNSSSALSLFTLTIGGVNVREPLILWTKSSQ